MATIGLKHLVVAPISAETDGSEPTYGTGMVMGHAMKAERSYTRADVKLFGDNALVARDNSISEGSLTVGTTHLTEAARAMVLGMDTYNTPGVGDPQEYADNDEPAPYVGVGYVTTETDGTTVKYLAEFYFKAQFGEDTENVETKGESTAYQTPELTGAFFGVKPDSTGKIRFRKYAFFDDEEDAFDWLDDLANVPSS